MEDVVEVIKIERRYIKDAKYDYISHEEINITWCGEPCFSQRRNISYNPHASETKVNEFIEWLNSSNKAHKKDCTLGKELKKILTKILEEPPFQNR